jgi:hypothetical protein
MNDLHIAPTVKTPAIDFYSIGNLKITGNSYPEDVTSFYQPVIYWLERFLNSNYEPVYLTINLTYINTSSIKSLLQIITKVSALSKNVVKVNWIYEIDDEDMVSVGEDLSRLSSLTFDFKAR